MFFVATQNFRGVERVLAEPPEPVAAHIEALGHAPLRALLRYQVSELNRFYFSAWEIAQMTLGLAVLLLLLFATKAGRLALILAGTALVLLAVMHWGLTQQITQIGRDLDFLDPDEALNLRQRFWSLHNLYSSLEVAKFLAIAALSGLLLFGKYRRNGESR